MMIHDDDNYDYAFGVTSEQVLESQARHPPSTWPNPFPLPGRWPAVRRKPLYKSGDGVPAADRSPDPSVGWGFGSLEPPFLDNVSKKNWLCSGNKNLVLFGVNWA